MSVVWDICFPPSGLYLRRRTNGCRILQERRTEVRRLGTHTGRAAFPEVHRLWACFSPLKESSMGNCRGLDEVALGGNRAPGLRYLLAITNRCPIIVGPIRAVLGRGCCYEAAT